MLAAIDSRQLTEVEAYWRIELDPEGAEARMARIVAAQKAPFEQAIAAAAARNKAQ